MPESSVWSNIIFHNYIITYMKFIYHNFYIEVGVHDYATSFLSLYYCHVFKNGGVEMHSTLSSCQIVFKVTAMLIVYRNFKTCYSRCRFISWAKITCMYVSKVGIFSRVFFLSIREVYLKGFSSMVNYQNSSWLINWPKSRSSSSGKFSPCLTRMVMVQSQPRSWEL